MCLKPFNTSVLKELKKSGTWKPQLELYKKQIAELHQRLNGETKRADKSDFECKVMTEKLNALQREKEVIKLFCYIHLCNLLLYSVYTYFFSV